MKHLSAFLWIIMALLFLSCLPSTPMVYFSRPEASKVSNEAFDARIETLKLDNPYYVAFQLTIFNKSTAPIKVDWNKTRYLHDGRDYGRFAFEGIDPESIHEGIPGEMIPTGQKLSKRIMPLKTLAFRGRKDTHRPGQSSFYPGILPSGLNTVRLVVSQGAREWNEKLSLQIGTREVKK